MFAYLKSAFADPFRHFLGQPDGVQHAALCHRMGPNGPEVLLITSSHGRWILPKGWPIDGLDGGETALQEAWEEAGVKGGVVEGSLGQFTALKQRDTGAALRCLTTVHAVRVDGMAQAFPEASRRDRRWVPLAEAADAVDEPGLVAILRRFAGRYDPAA